MYRCPSASPEISFGMSTSIMRDQTQPACPCESRTSHQSCRIGGGAGGAGAAGGGVSFDFSGDFPAEAVVGFAAGLGAGAAWGGPGFATEARVMSWSLVFSGSRK